MNIPASALQDILCGKCQNPLAGISHTYPGQELSVCAECTTVMQGQNFREIAYEALATNFLFPCPNKDCYQKLTPAKLGKHLILCSYKSQMCILECGWRGTESRLVEHFTDAHPTEILRQNKLEKFRINKAFFPKYLLVTEEQSFLVEVSVEAEFFGVFVSFPYDSPKKDKYNALLTRNNNCRKFVIESYRRSADKKPCSKFKIEDSKEISIEMLVLNTNVSIPKAPSENHLLLNSLICTICRSYMYGKIYLCANSHNACASCKKEPCFCLNIFTTRNHTLESLTAACLYPCKHPGCPYLLKSNEKQAHENTCEFSTFPCPICSKVGITRTNIQDHFNSTHKFYIKKSPCLEFAFTEAAVIDCFYFLRESGYFRLTHKYLDRNFLFSVQYFGNPSLAELYTFCVSAKNSEGVFSAERNCTVFTKLEDVFCEPDRFLLVPSSLLKPFITNKTLHYLVHIYKKSLIK